MKRISRTMSAFLLYTMTIAVCALLSVRMVANASADAAQEEAEPVGSTYYESWYELSEDAQVLTLRLENHIPGYSWKLGASDDDLLDIADYYYDEYDDRIIVLTGSGGEEGSLILTAACMRDIYSRPISRKQLRVHVYKDGHMSCLQMEE